MGQEQSLQKGCRLVCDHNNSDGLYSAAIID